MSTLHRPDEDSSNRSVGQPSSSTERPERPRAPKPTKFSIPKPEISDPLEHNTQRRPRSSNTDDSSPLLSEIRSSSYPGTAEVLSNEPDAHNGTPNTQQEKNVLYQITCIDITDRRRNAIIDRYSDTPFEGFEETSQGSGRHDQFIMDDVQEVFGFPNRERQSQQKEHVGTDDLADSAIPFRGGLDFRVTERGKRCIRIWSQEVIRVLRHEIKYYPRNQIIDSYGQSSTSEEPFRLWMWHWKRMWQICKDDDTPLRSDSLSSSPDTVATCYNAVTREHLKAVLTRLQPFYDKEIAPELRLHEEQHKVTWRNLWLLFKPGSIVVQTWRGFVQFYVVCFVDLVHYLKEREECFNIITWNLVFDGHRLRRQITVHDFPEYSGEVDFQKLRLKPLKYVEGSVKEKQKAILRGRKYYQIICEAPTHFEYNGYIGGDDRVHYAGPVFIDPSINSEASRPKLGSVHGEDNPEMFVSREPSDDGGGELFSAYNDIKVSKGGGPEDSDIYLLMPTRIAGFALRRKEWTVFDVEGFKNKDHDSAANALDFVVMSPNHRLLLKGLAASYQVPGLDSLMTDFVDGKGKGHIVALHGPPGVGKTLTVECLANDLGRPLLALTVADMGNDENKIESVLSSWLDLAQKWNAIVLVDEADMYLGKRQKKKELSRNAMVAALLRALEYFTGILFITTTRLDELDDAFISRFHLILQYQRLNDENRGDIWRKFFAKLENDQKTLKEGDARIIVENHVQAYITTDPQLQTLEMNGRDIRNAFHAMIQIAVNRTFTSGQTVKTVRVTEQDVRCVIQNKHAIKAYRNETHMGKNEE